MSPYRMSEILPQQKYDAVVAAANSDFYRAQAFSQGNVGVQQFAVKTRDQRIAAAAERLRIELAARQEKVDATPVLPEGIE